MVSISITSSRDGDDPSIPSLLSLPLGNQIYVSENVCSLLTQLVDHAPRWRELVCLNMPPVIASKVLSPIQGCLPLLESLTLDFDRVWQDFRNLQEIPRLRSLSLCSCVTWQNRLHIPWAHVISLDVVGRQTNLPLLLGTLPQLQCANVCQ